MAAPLKRCLVRRRDGREQHGLAASCLRELRDKGEEEEGGTHGDRPGTAGLYASPGGGGSSESPVGCRAPPLRGLAPWSARPLFLGEARSVPWN